MNSDQQSRNLRVTTRNSALKTRIDGLADAGLRNASHLIYMGVYAIAMLISGKGRSKRRAAALLAKKVEAGAQIYSPLGLALLVNAMVISLFGTLAPRQEGGSRNESAITMTIAPEGFFGNSPTPKPPGGGKGASAAISNALLTAVPGMTSTPMPTVALNTPSAVLTHALNAPALAFDVQPTRPTTTDVAGAANTATEGTQAGEAANTGSNTEAGDGPSNGSGEGAGDGKGTGQGNGEGTGSGSGQGKYSKANPAKSGDGRLPRSYKHLEGMKLYVLCEFTGLFGAGATGSLRAPMPGAPMRGTPAGTLTMLGPTLLPALLSASNKILGAYTAGNDALHNSEGGINGYQDLTEFEQLYNGVLAIADAQKRSPIEGASLVIMGEFQYGKMRKEELLYLEELQKALITANLPLFIITSANKPNIEITRMAEATGGQYLGRLACVEAQNQIRSKELRERLGWELTFENNQLRFQAPASFGAKIKIQSEAEAQIQEFQQNKQSAEPVAESIPGLIGLSQDATVPTDAEVQEAQRPKPPQQ